MRTSLRQVLPWHRLMISPGLSCAMPAGLLNARFFREMNSTTSPQSTLVAADKTDIGSQQIVHPPIIMRQRRAGAGRNVADSLSSFGTIFVACLALHQNPTQSAVATRSTPRRFDVLPTKRRYGRRKPVNRWGP
jgi:hypothetical protein